MRIGRNANMGLLVFLAAGTLAFSVMAAVRVRGSVKRRTERILTDEERKANYSRSLQHSSQKTVAKLIESTTKHYGSANDENMAPSLLTKSADYVAEAGYRGLMSGHRTIVPGFINNLVTVLLRFVPRRLLLKVVDSRQTRRRSAQGT